MKKKNHLFNENLPISMNGLCPRPHASGHFWRRRVFLRFSLQCTRKRRFRTPKTQAFKQVPQSGSFRKRRLIVCVRTKTEVFEHNDTCNDVTHTTLPLRLLCKRYYRIFIVLVFSCEPAKNDSNTLRLASHADVLWGSSRVPKNVCVGGYATCRHEIFWNTKEKNLRFQKICGYVWAGPYFVTMGVVFE